MPCWFGFRRSSLIAALYSVRVVWYDRESPCCSPFYCLSPAPFSRHWRLPGNDMTGNCIGCIVRLDWVEVQDVAFDDPALLLIALPSRTYLLVPTLAFVTSSATRLFLFLLLNKLATKLHRLPPCFHVFVRSRNNVGLMPKLSDNREWVHAKRKSPTLTRSSYAKA